MYLCLNYSHHALSLNEVRNPLLMEERPKPLPKGRSYLLTIGKSVICGYLSHNEVFCYRRLFHLFTFFFLFYYMLIGLFKAIRRVIVSAALNVFYFTRVDTPLTIRGWEFLDKGMYTFHMLLQLSFHL